MKFIKKFEDIEPWNEDLKIGDIVECIEGYREELTTGKIYEIEDIKKFSHYFQLKIKDIGSFWWASSRFKKATPDQIKKYKLKKDTEKYNL